MTTTDGSETTPASGERMQRVRVGVTGLAAVILIVALATAIATGVRRNTVPDNSAGIATVSETRATAAASGNTTDSASEPLAQLGVAPGASTTKGGQAEPAPSH